MSGWHNRYFGYKRSNDYKQWFFYGRNIGLVTPNIIHLHNIVKKNLDQSMQKNNNLIFENGSTDHGTMWPLLISIVWVSNTSNKQALNKQTAEFGGFLYPSSKYRSGSVCLAFFLYECWKADRCRQLFLSVLIESRIDATRTKSWCYTH